MFVNVLLPVMGAHELLKPNGCGQFGVEETKWTLCCRRRCIAELDLVKLCRERLVVVKVVLAMSVPFNGAGYPLVTLEAELCEAMFVFKVLFVTSKDMVPSIRCWDPVISTLASFI